MGALWRQTAERGTWQDDSRLRRSETDHSLNVCPLDGCEQVSVTMSEACLRRLLGARHLVVEEIHCEDHASRDCVRRMLLSLVSGKSPRA